MSILAILSCILALSLGFKPILRHHTHFGDITVSADTYNVLDYGAIGDGKTDDTKSVQSTIDAACSSSDGGTVYFPDGYTFLLFPLVSQNAQSNITFQVDATLLINSDRDTYEKVYGDVEWWSFVNISNWVLTGSGTINGQGDAWWGHSFRPRMIYGYAPDTNNILISDLTFENSPKMHLFLHSNNVEIRNTIIQAPTSSPNTDGIDPNGNNYYIHDNYISVGDDNVAIKSGNDSVISNNYLGTGHGLSIGSLNGSYLTNITFDNNIFNDTTNGYRIKSYSGSTYGRVWDIYFKNGYMDTMDWSIVIDQFYGSGDTTQSYMIFDHIYITNLTSHNSQHSGEFMCQPSTPCHDIYLQDIWIAEKSYNDKLKAFPFACENAYGTATNVTPDSCLESDYKYKDIYQN